MLALFSQGCSVTVTREGQRLVAVVNNLSTIRDDYLRLEVDLPGLVIAAADLESNRNLFEPKFSTSLEDLKDQVVNFELFAAVTDIFLPGSPEQRGYFRHMLLEAFTAILQSETFFYIERGFCGPAEYDAFWKELSRDSCRYYSNLDCVTKEFSTHVADQERVRHLFSRQRQALLVKDGAMLRATASMRDSFHEMHSWWVVDEISLTILEARGKVVRAPDRICAETEALFEPLIGKDASVNNRRDIRATVDGPQGCSHFGDLAMDLVWLVDAYCSQRYLDES